MYAADVKLYCMFSDKDSCKAFQLDINEVVKWASLWKLKISLPKL